MTPTLTSLFAALLVIAPLTQGLYFDGPKPTAIRNGDAIIRQGHRIPQSPMETTAPDIQHAKLFKRDHFEPLLIGPDNTCGYFNGNASQYFSCVATSYRCDFYLSFYSTESTSAGVLRCCPTTGLCNAAVVTQCIDAKAYAAGTTCLDDSCVVCTSTAYPYCNGATFPALGVKNFYCGYASSSTYDTAFQTYLNQFPDRLYITSSYLAADLSTSTTSTSTPNLVSTTTITPPPTPTPTPPTPTPIGAIVGGVVGGVAVIAGIVALIWLMRRRRKNQANENQQSPHVQLQQFPPPVDPKAPYTTQTSPVQPPYYQAQPGYQQQVPYYQQPGFQQQQQQPYAYGQQYPEAQHYPPTQQYAQPQQYSTYAGESEGTSPVPFNKTPTDAIAVNRLSQAPTAATSPNPGSNHSPNPQRGSRLDAFEIEA